MLVACRRRPRTAEVAEVGSGGTAFLSTPSIFFSLDKELRAKCRVFDVSLECGLCPLVWAARPLDWLAASMQIISLDSIRITRVFPLPSSPLLEPRAGILSTIHIHRVGVCLEFSTESGVQQ